MNNRFHSGRLVGCIFRGSRTGSLRRRRRRRRVFFAGRSRTGSGGARAQPPSLQEAAVIKSRALPSGERAEAVEISLGPLNLSKNALLLQDPGARLIGLARPLPASGSPEATAALLHWHATPAGGLVAALSVSAQGAYGLRMGLRVEAWPSSAMLRVYSQSRPETAYEMSGQQILQLIARNLEAGDAEAAARTWWTPETGSPEQTLEIELPAGTDPSALRLSVPQVSHIFEDLSFPEAPGNQDQRVRHLQSGRHMLRRARRAA